MFLKTLKPDDPILSIGGISNLMMLATLKIGRESVKKNQDGRGENEKPKAPWQSFTHHDAGKPFISISKPFISISKPLNN